MKIYIGTDHAGFHLKEGLLNFITSLGYEVVDKGAFSLNDQDDYPDFVRPVAEAVSSDIESMGIILGGSGQGEMMTANKVPGIRAALFYGSVIAKSPVDINGRLSVDPYEIVKLTRVHNNANILSLSSRFLSISEVEEAVKIFLETPFSGDPRHIRRITKMENK